MGVKGVKRSPPFMVDTRPAPMLKGRNDIKRAKRGQVKKGTFPSIRMRQPKVWTSKNSYRGNRPNCVSTEK